MGPNRAETSRPLLCAALLLVAAAPEDVVDTASTLFEEVEDPKTVLG